MHANHASNRTRACMLMLARLPLAHTEAEVEAQAIVLERFPQKDRDRWANASGVKSPPSPETWALLVAMARLRKPVSIEDVRAAADRRRAS